MEITSFFKEVVITFNECAVAALAFLAALNAIWLWRQRRSDIMRETWELFLPSTKSTEDILDALRGTSGMPKPHVLEPAHTITIDRYRDYTGIHHYITTSGRVSANLDELLYQHLDATLEPVERELDPIRTTRWEAAVELSLRGFKETLRVNNPEGVAATFEAHLQDVAEGEAKNIQIVFKPGHPIRPTDDRDKVADHTFDAIVRLGAAGERAEHLLKDLISPFRSIESPGAKFVARWVRQAAGRLNRRAGTWGFSCLFNVRELRAIAFGPSGIGTHKARRLAPTYLHESPGPGKIMFGTSNAPKMRHRQVAMAFNGEQNRSIQLLGESGSGKSALLHNLSVQIIAEPDNAFLGIEPAGDLMEAIGQSIPESRWQDVIYFDPLDADYPIGINPLRGNDPEHVASHIVSMLKTLYILRKRVDTPRHNKGS